jgi:hypothetical protein
MTERRKITWERHVAGTRCMRDAYKIFIKDHFGHLGIYEKIMDLKGKCVKVHTEIN